MAERQVNPQNARRPGSDDDTYERVIKSIEVTGECPFCPERLREVHPNPILIDGQEWAVTDSAFPYKGSEQHVLFIAKRHILTIGELSIESWAELQGLIVDIERLRKIGGATLLMRSGDSDYTGASVAHLHAHLVSGGNDNDSPAIVTKVGNTGSR